MPGSFFVATPTTVRLTAQIALHLASLNTFHPAPAFGTWAKRRSTPANGDFLTFIDPDLRAPDAPVCWLQQSGAIHLVARAMSATTEPAPDLDLIHMPAIPHVIIRDDGHEIVQVRTTDRFLNLWLRGERAIDGPVHLTFLVDGLTNIRSTVASLSKLADLKALTVRWQKRSRRQFVMRDALIALDANAGGASYRDIAFLIIGRQRAVGAWTSPSRALKDRMRRLLAKGRQFRNGGYRRLIS